MKRLAKLRHILLGTLAVLAILVVAVLVAAHFYLRSGHATQQVQAQLEDALGVPVEVGSAQIGLQGNTEVRNLRLIDESDHKPFLQVEQADVDMSVLRYLGGGRSPRRIDLRDAHLRLRFDAAGKLLTQLQGLSRASSSGGTLPTVRIHGSSITIDQEGRAPFTIKDISLALESHKGECLSGVINDPVWGQIDLSGDLRPGGDFSITLTSKGVALTHAMLRSLPLAPPVLWTKIEVDGPSVPMTFTLAGNIRAGGDKEEGTGPSALSTVHYGFTFSGARITLPQPDRPAMVASPASGKLEGNEKGFRLNGVIRDHYWGDWVVTAGLAAQTGEIKVELHTSHAVVDQQKLEALPYVPKSVWQQAKASGQTAVDITTDLFTHKPDVHYRVDLHVKEATVYVTSIDLQATRAAGEVIIEDDRVLLRNVTGRTAEGTITTSDDLNFAIEPNRMKFDVVAKGLVLKELPRKWDLPEQLEGKLSGKANVVVTLKGGNPIITGSGRGEITDVKLLGLPAKPIPLELSTDGKGIRLTPKSPMAHMLLYVAAPELTTVPVIFMRQADKDPGTRGSLQPARLVGQAMSGLGAGINLLVGGASAVLHQVGRVNRPVKPGTPPVYLNATMSLTDVDLADLIRRMGVTLPFEVAGRLSFNVKVGIPINSARDVKAYRLDGSVTLPRLSVAGVEMVNVSAGLNYQNGVLRLDKLSGGIGKGTFGGNATVQVVPRGNLSVDLALRELPTAELLRPFPALAGKGSGILSLTVRAGVPLERLRDPVAWTGTASLRVPEMNVYGVVVRNVSTGLSVLRGLALLSDLKGEVEGGKLSGSASLSLTGAQRFQGDVKVVGLDVARLMASLPESWRRLPSRGTVTASADLRGTLQPLKVDASGKLSSGAVRVEGVQFDRMSLGWTLADRIVKVSDLKATLYRGEITGTAAVPLTNRLPGSLDLKIANVDLLTLAGSLGGLPFRIEGRVSGTAIGSYVPPKDEGKGKKVQGGAWTADVNVAAPTLKVQNVPVEKLRGKVEYRDGKGEYHLEGDVLGGKVNIDGKLPPTTKSSADWTDGRVRVEGVRLSRLWQAFGLRRRLGPLSGVLTVDLPFRYEGPSRMPVGEGRFEIRDLSYRDNEVSSTVRGGVRLTSEGVFVRNVNADIAGGTLRAGIAYRFGSRRPGSFTLSLTNVEASRLLVFDQGKDTVQGPIDLSLRGRLGREWRAAGSLEMSRGKVLGVEVVDWHLPLDITFAPATERGELLVRESSAQVGNGRARLNVTFHWNDFMRLEGSLRFFDAGLRSLSGVLGDVSSYAQGRVTGRLDFSGGEVRSLNDLTATLEAKLREAQALQLPILSLAVPYLLPGQGSTTFRSGDVRARLGNGVWRISQMTLLSNVAQLIVQGIITVQGRLDLIVTGRTSSLGGIDPVIPSLLARNLPPVGPVPVGLIVRVTEFLSNRMVHLHVTGTTKEPQVQVEALRVLSEEAVRLFLTGGTVP